MTLALCCTFAHAHISVDTCCLKEPQADTVLEYLYVALQNHIIKESTVIWGKTVLRARENLFDFPYCKGSNSSKLKMQFLCITEKPYSNQQAASCAILFIVGKNQGYRRTLVARKMVFHNAEKLHFSFCKLIHLHIFWKKTSFYAPSKNCVQISESIFQMARNYSGLKQ